MADTKIERGKGGMEVVLFTFSDKWFLFGFWIPQFNFLEVISL